MEAESRLERMIEEMELDCVWFADTMNKMGIAYNSEGKYRVTTV